MALCRCWTWPIFQASHALPSARLPASAYLPGTQKVMPQPVQADVMALLERIGLAGDDAARALLPWVRPARGLPPDPQDVRPANAAFHTYL